MNRTRQYLYPVMNTFGKTFLQEMNNLTSYKTGNMLGKSIQSITICDWLWYSAKRINIESLKETPYLFIVFDTKGLKVNQKYSNIVEGQKRFKQFLIYARTNKHYIEDYWVGNNQHCIIFSIKEFQDSFKHFFYSQYSKMYTQEQIKTLKIASKVVINKQETDRPVHAVLTKNHEVGSVYLKKVIFENYGVDTIPDNPDEYDIPWLVQDEILNHIYLGEDLATLKQIRYDS